MSISSQVTEERKPITLKRAAERYRQKIRADVQSQEISPVHANRLKAIVTSGQQIGVVGEDGSNDHLHLGIRRGNGLPPSDGVTYGWGRADIAWFQAHGTNGFEAPVEFFLSQSSTAVVRNGRFPFGSTEDWTHGGEGVVTLVHDSTSDYYRAVRTTGSPVTLGQVLSTPQAPFLIGFDYEFLTTTGTLEVWLGSHLVGSLSAPASLEGSESGFEAAITDPSMVGLSDVLLDLRADAVTGSQVDREH